MSDIRKTTINIGNLWNSDWHGGYGGTIFGTKGLSPAMNSMNGGNRMPFVIAVKRKDIKSDCERLYI